MRISMPSPKGTNFEGLFLTGRLAELVAPTMAYNSKYGIADHGFGIARDQGGPPPSQERDPVCDGLARLLQFLKANLRNDAYKQAELQIGQVMNLSRERSADHQRQLNEVSNSGGETDAGPPSFLGKPADPAPAQDSADVFAIRPTGKSSLDEILHGDERRAAAAHKRSRDQLQKHLDRIQVLG